MSLVDIDFKNPRQWSNSEWIRFSDICYNYLKFKKTKYLNQKEDFIQFCCLEILSNGTFSTKILFHRYLTKYYGDIRCPNSKLKRDVYFNNKSSNIDDYGNLIKVSNGGFMDVENKNYIKNLLLFLNENILSIRDRKIIVMLCFSGLSQSVIAKKFKVSQASISGIREKYKNCFSKKLMSGETTLFGKVRWFDNLKGEGLIRCSEGNSYYVHYSSIKSKASWKTLKKNQTVSFSVYIDSHFTQVNKLELI